MPYTIPTSKLRDLITVLQTLDPDIEHSVEEVTVEAYNKRRISFGGMTEEEFIERLGSDVDIGPTKTLAELGDFIADLQAKRDELTETIGKIRDALSDSN